MNVAYIRVSSQEQNEARQMEALKSFGIEKFYVEKVSGKNTERRQFKRMLLYLREGDTLYITEWSRLSRSTMDLLTTVQTLTKNGVKIVSAKENFDTSTPYGKLMLTVFAGLAEFERTLILERQREGIEIAKKQGKYKGRVPKELDNFDEVVSSWHNGEITAVAAAKLLGINRGTFYQRVKKLDQQKNSQ